MPKVSQAHRDARRRQILTAATRCVEREGFHRTTMADVIGEAGLSAGAVYGYFKSKTELIRAIIADSALGLATERLEQLAGGETEVTPAIVLEEFLTTALETYGDSSPQITVQVWAEAARDPQVAEMASARIQDLRQVLTRLVRRCQDEGSLNPDGDPDQMARVLYGLLAGYVVQRLLDHDLSSETYLRGATDLIGPAGPPHSSAGDG